MSRLSRKNRTYGDIGHKSSGGIMDLFDNEVKSAFRINDEEYDYLIEKMSDDELGLFVGKPEGLNFSEKRSLINIVEGYLKNFRKAKNGL
jgi:hypothetical protein